MNKTLKSILIIFILALSFTMFGCSSAEEPQNGDPYTVTFVDRDGTVLETYNCTVGQDCNITAPDVPNPNISSKVYFTRWSVFPDDFDKINTDTTIKAIYTYSNIAISIGGRDIVFYSLFIMTGIFVGLLLGIKETSRIGLKKDDLIDGFLWIVPVAILGARLWFVAFSWSAFHVPGYPIDTFMQVIGFDVTASHQVIWSSFGLAGLAIHGAFVTAIICAYFYTRKRKIDIFKVLDVVAVGFIIAQAFGRWGNFFNQEAHGGIVGGLYYGSDNVWHANLSIQEQYNYLRYTLHIPNFIVNNMYIAQNLHVLADGKLHFVDGIRVYTTELVTGFYHPTFFYESMINLLGFGIMLILRRIKKVHFGELLSFYLIWYGGLRIFIETMRTDPLEFQMFGITFKSAIVTSVIMILLGIALSTYIRIKRKGKDYSTVPGYFGYKKEKEEIEEAVE